MRRKCAKFVVGKKSALGDRPANRKHERPITWDRLPFATSPLLTSEDADVQRVKVSVLLNKHCSVPDDLSHLVLGDLE